MTWAGLRAWKRQEHVADEDERRAAVATPEHQGRLRYITNIVESGHTDKFHKKCAGKDLFIYIITTPSSTIMLYFIITYTLFMCTI